MRKITCPAVRKVRLRRTASFCGGQSLLEIVVALMVAMLVLTALAKVAVSSLNSSNFAKNEALATQYARQTLEEVRSLKESDPTSFFSGASACAIDTNMGNFNIVRDCTLGVDEMTVLVTVSWSESGQDYQSTLETKFTQH